MTNLRIRPLRRTAQQRLGPRWYTGSADAIYQSMNLIEDEDPDYLLVFGADNIYRMDPRQMLEQHIDTGAAVARQLQRLLSERQLLANGPAAPEHFWCSGEPLLMQRVLPTLWGSAASVSRFS